MKRLLCALVAVFLLCGCAAVPAGTTEPAGPVLKAGFYLPAAEELSGTLLYIQLRENGTGCMSVLGMTKELTWTPEGAMFGDMTITPTAGGLLADDEAFEFIGESLPDGYLPDPPAPGVWVASSVGKDGNVSFYGVPSKENGWFELKEDGTGVLVYEDAEYPFTMEGTIARFDGWSVMLMDAGEGLPEGETMAVIYITEGPIQADSIAFRKLEE